MDRFKDSNENIVVNEETKALKIIDLDKPLYKSEINENVINISENQMLTELDKPLYLSETNEKTSDLSQNEILTELDKPLYPSESNENIKNCPIDGNNGSWDGERGNSTWCPDPEYVPKQSNPEGRIWGEILDKYGIEGITYNDGEPDFSEISKGNVEIEPFSEERSDNFDRADIELAKQKGCSPEEVAKWRKENGYTWHECKDMKTMQKVPSEVHINVSHRGGISEKKKGNGEV